MGTGDWRQALTELAREMTVCTGGMDMLGSATRGELSAMASGIGPQAMQKRAAKVHMLVDRVMQRSVYKSGTHGLDIAGQGGDCGPHLRCTPGAAGYIGGCVEGA